MEDVLLSGSVDAEYSDVYLSTVFPVKQFSLLENERVVSLEKIDSLNSCSDTSGSQHSVTGYSFLAFAEKYLDLPTRSLDVYDGLPCSLSSSTCSPTTKSIRETTDLGVSYVSSLFKSSVTNGEPCEENSGELFLPMEGVVVDKEYCNKQEQLSSMTCSRISESTFESC